MILALTPAGWIALKSVWLTSACIGVVVTSVLLYMAVSDERFLKSRKINSWRQYVAKTSRLIFIGGFVTQTIYMILGIISITRPNPPANIKIPTEEWIATCLFITGVWVSIVLGIAIFYRRRKIIEIIERVIESENK